MREEWLIKEETIISIAWEFDLNNFNITLENLQCEINSCASLNRVQQRKFNSLM